MVKKKESDGNRLNKREQMGICRMESAGVMTKSAPYQQDLRWFKTDVLSS